jgi:hypothetical protein
LTATAGLSTTAGEAAELVAQCRPAVDQFRHDVRRVAIHLGVEDRDDVRMIQRACGARFGDEPNDPFGIAIGSLAQDLECDLALEAGIPGAVHFAGAAAIQ